MKLLAVICLHVDDDEDGVMSRSRKGMILGWTTTCMLNVRTRKMPQFLRHNYLDGCWRISTKTYATGIMQIWIVDRPIFSVELDENKRLVSACIRGSTVIVSEPIFKVNETERIYTFSFSN